MKLKEQTKSIENKYNNQSKAAIIFNDLINKRKKYNSELHDSVDDNNLRFEYVGPTKDVGFYGYKDSKELFNAIKNNQIKFSEVKEKMGKTTAEQKEVINNLNKFYNSREEVTNFFRDYIEMLSDANYNAKQGGGVLEILTPKQMLQRLPITHEQVKAGNNSESLLN